MMNIFRQHNSRVNKMFKNLRIAMELIHNRLNANVKKKQIQLKKKKNRLRLPLAQES